MKAIPDTQVVWSGKVKTTNGEEFSEVFDASRFNNFVLVVECSAITGTNLTFDVYTNASGGANPPTGLWEKIKDNAITITAASCISATLPDPTDKKNLGVKFMISVTGNTLTTATFSAYIVRRL